MLIQDNVVVFAIASNFNNIKCDLVDLALAGAAFYNRFGRDLVRGNFSVLLGSHLAKMQGYDGSINVPAVLPLLRLLLNMSEELDKACCMQLLADWILALSRISDRKLPSADECFELVVSHVVRHGDIFVNYAFECRKDVVAVAHAAPIAIWTERIVESVTDFIPPTQLSISKLIKLHKKLKNTLETNGNRSTKLTLLPEEKGLLKANNLFAPTSTQAIVPILSDILRAILDGLPNLLASISVDKLLTKRSEQERLAKLALWSGKSPDQIDAEFEGVAVPAERYRIEEYSKSPKKAANVAEVSEAAQSAEIIEVSLHKTAFEGAWEILLSATAQSVLKATSVSHKIRDAILAKLKSIADGIWTESVAKPLRNNGLMVPVYSAIVFKTCFIIWQVDYGWVEATQSNSQFIKIWAIGRDTEVISVLRKVVVAHKAYSKEHIEKCQTLNTHLTKKVPVMPRVFGSDAEDEKKVIPVNCCNEMDKLIMHDMAVTAKFVPLSKMVLNWILSPSAAENAEFPFCLSKVENDIVRHPNSLLLCGRSGTGKTSCIVFRMLSMYCAYHMNSKAPLYGDNPLAKNSKLMLSKPTSETVDVGQDLHQVFITASPAFCERVRAYFEKLVLAVTRGNLKDGETGALTVGQRTELLLSSIGAVEASNSEDGNETVDKFLESILNPTPTENGASVAESPEEGEAAKVPDSLMDLKSEHFPLFITYRKFISMIRNAFHLNDTTPEIDSALPSDVEYFTFAHKYWPHMDLNLKKKFHPVMVYNEIMGVIKGSENAARSPKGYLERTQYIDLPTKSFGAFSGDRRDLYNLFCDYQKKKGIVQDVQDSINEVNRLILKNGYHGSPIHEIYVDEVQDLTMAQLFPLVSICSSPGHGLMLAGDTAQTISRGSSFRFQDLSSMIYRTLAGKGGEEFAKKCQPKQFQLTRNYRSHDGILQVAASVLDLIKKYFPNSIDDLARDAGSVDGPFPVCLLGDDKNLQNVFGMTLTEVAPTSQNIGCLEFGADQVILVRNDEDSTLLREQIGESVLIMTIEECKGMEFDDVLLFEPFGSSPARDAWRLFLQGKGKAPAFSEAKHNILSSELKILYTGITRARNMLWIYDSDADAREALFGLWHSQSLVELIGPSAFSTIRFQFQKRSTPEEWRQKGMKLLENQRYQAALVCFSQENRLKPTKESKLRILQTEANFCRVEGLKFALEGKPDLANENFLAAAKLFQKVGGSSKRLAAQCYDVCLIIANRGSFFQLAAEIYLELESFEDAARCFVSAEKFKAAADCYVKIGLDAKALEIYKNGGHWDEAIDLLKINLERAALGKSLLIPAPVRARVVTLAVKHYKKIKNNERVLDAVTMMADKAEIEDMLKSERLFESLSEFYLKHGDFVKAGQVLELELNDLSKAALAYDQIPGLRMAVKATTCELSILLDSLFASRKGYVLGESLTEDELSICLNLCLRRKAALENAIASYEDAPADVPTEIVAKARSLGRILSIANMILDRSLPSNYEEIMAECESSGDTKGLFLAVLGKLADFDRKDTIAEANFGSKSGIHVKEFMTLYGQYLSTITWALKLQKLIQKFWHVIETYRAGHMCKESDLLHLGVVEELFGFHSDRISLTSLRISNMKRIQTKIKIASKDEVGRCRVEATEAHVAIRGILRKLLHDIPLRFERPLAMLCDRDICINYLVNESCKIKGCSLSHILFGSIFDTRFKLKEAMCELLVVAREHCVEAARSSIEKSQRKWFQSLILNFRPWDGNIPIPPVVISERLAKISPVVAAGIFSHINEDWLTGKQPTGFVGHCLMIAFTLSHIVKNEADFKLAFDEMIARTTVPKQISFCVSFFFAEPDPIDWVKSFCELVNVFALNFVSKMGELEMQIYIWMFERVIAAVFILTAARCLLPASWAEYVVKRFPELKLGNLKMEGAGLSNMVRDRFLATYQNVAKASDSGRELKLRISFLYVITMQKDEIVAGIAKSVDPRPLHSWNMIWPKSLQKSTAYESARKVATAMSDPLVYLTTTKSNTNFGTAMEKVGVKVLVGKTRTILDALRSMDLLKEFKKSPLRFITSVAPKSTPTAMSRDEAARKIAKWFKRNRRTDRQFDRMYAEAVAKTRKWSGEDAIASFMELELEKDADSMEDSAVKKIWRYRCLYLAESVSAIRMVDEALEKLIGLSEDIGSDFGEEYLDLADQVSELRDQAYHIRDNLGADSASHAKFHFGTLESTFNRAIYLSTSTKYLSIDCKRKREETRRKFAEGKKAPAHVIQMDEKEKLEVKKAKEGLFANRKGKKKGR
ncbi:hypothetical protein HDU97_009714 [Phlyctochytrium planicorne]|nr:hypothetical protein HDU97_009714 [Phlyctochytrium planicorne]